VPVPLQRGSDLRGIQDLGYFSTDAAKKIEDASAVFKDYVGGWCHLHVHFGLTRHGKGELQTRYYCAAFEFRGLRGRLEGKIDAIGEGDVVVGLGNRACHEVKRMVLVVVGEVAQGKQVLAGRLASTIFVTALDEFDWPAIDARKSRCLLRPESGALVVDRKLHPPRFAGARNRAVRDELPGDVIENTTVVVDRVSESSGIGVRQVRQTFPDDEANPEALSDTQPGWLAFLFDAEGCVGVTLEEAPGFSLGGVRMEFARFSFSLALSSGSMR
jgi:hypothetical protein